jgi:hypothetical protein
VLDATARGLLDKIIDEIEETIPFILWGTRETGKKQYIQNAEDYVRGAVQGYIGGKFFSVFSMMYQRYPDEEERKEMQEVINNRATELRTIISEYREAADQEKA